MTPLLLLVLLCSPLCQPNTVEGWGATPVPSESECRPYIEKALKERSPQEAVDTAGSEQVVTPSSTPEQEGSLEETEDNDTKESKEDEPDKEAQAEGSEESSETGEVTDTDKDDKEETLRVSESVQEEDTSKSEDSGETPESTTEDEVKGDKSIEETEEGGENIAADQPSVEDGSESAESGDNTTQSEEISTKSKETEDESTEKEQSAETPDEATTEETSVEGPKSDEDTTEDEKQGSGSEEGAGTGEDSGEEKQDDRTEDSVEKVDKADEIIESSEDQGGEESAEVPGGEVTDSAETTESLETATSTENASNKDPQVTEEDTTEASVENDTDSKQNSSEASAEATDASAEELNETQETSEENEQPASKEESSETKEDSSPVSNETQSGEATESSEKTDDASAGSTEETDVDSAESKTNATVTEGGQESGEESSETSDENEEQKSAEGEDAAKESEPTIEDQLTLEFEAPAFRRPRDHITEILHLSPEAAETELLLAKTIDSTLKELKKLYDVAIKPLEILFKYRDLSNRHFGDPEIFSKPLILFMGPWSGGKSTIVNYLLDNEFKSSSLRTGAEPSPAYFNILMWGEREEVLDGTQLAADWTFSGLQKFGQGLLDRLRGLRLNSPILEKVNIVEIPGILEIRKQVERLFPFNDACQWFIDRADIIFLVYDPSKLDVGPETEAILDQLKGREYQTRIILNKADQVKPEELMRVQGTLIWNISPLMSSTEPPVMYSTSLWSLPYEQGAPTRLLHAQERAFLRDLRQAVDKRVENKIASARRFAVRVRNHAKMVDCYLTTYYNHKSFFGNKKKVADDIIEHPQNYHIYEGLSTLTNISRYDLPDPEVYRDFFRLNPLYDFQRLSDTCTYFRGCPINRLDVAIAYDLPELVGKYKKQAEKVLEIAAEKQATKS